MPTEMGIWRIDGHQPHRLRPSAMPLESQLEDFLAKDPSLLGDRLLVVGRQVRTPYNKFIDLLAIDAEGTLHVLELKRDKTPREVVAQVLDYGSWVSTLERDEIIDLASHHLREPFEPVFDRTFGGPVPDEFTNDIQLTVVASSLDPSSERIVTYLRDFGVPINAVFFSFVEDDGRQYLARSWFATEDPSEATPAGGSRRTKQAKWNGQDWYVNFGEGDSRVWEDGRKYGFISAGGGEWYSRTLRNLPVDARVNVYLPQKGYVAVGTTLRDAARVDQAEVLHDGRWQLLTELPTEGSYRHEGIDDGTDRAEYVVPVEWEVAVPAHQAYREPGLFASQHSACKLRQDFTLKKLAEHFDLDRTN
ncbi:endonuclease NucS domain-containing protein [uncultured Ornithinimicrobium sp.]|uniref:endonuclease NucS domain-containing protein n=1 Tax=uncultured Ornithinimicrobium sp. TaxID=259307 RepID=UPI00259444EA|nr:endonuclease NucS domain-containing protein [uncultured Ornithinimicrobium sp.]